MCFRITGQAASQPRPAQSISPTGRCPAAPRITNEDLLAGLRRYARTHRLPPRRPFSVTTFDTWPARPFCAATVINRFGSWKAALALIDIPNAPPRRHDNAQLIAEFERLWREIGRPPGCTIMRSRSRFAPDLYQRRWGSLRRLADLITRHRRDQLSRAELLNPEPPPTARSFIPISIRWHVIQRDRFRCVLCGHSPAKGADTELHLEPHHPRLPRRPHHPCKPPHPLPQLQLGTGVPICQTSLA